MRRRRHRSVGERRRHSTLDALGELPESAAGDAPLVLTGDLARASEIGGLDRPSNPDDSDPVHEWISGLGGGTLQSDVFVPWPQALFPSTSQPVEAKDTYGWSVLDVDAFAAVSLPPDDFLVVSGDFDDKTLDGGLAEVDGEEDIVTDLDGADHDSGTLDPTPLNRYGAPTRLAEDDGRIAASPNTEAVRDWLDDTESLADDDSYADLARALDEHDVYSAVFTAAEDGDPAAAMLGEGAGPEEVEELRAELDGVLPDDPYDAIGLGWASDDDGALVVMAYHFDSDDAAENSKDALEEL